MTKNNSLKRNESKKNRVLQWSSKKVCVAKRTYTMGGVLGSGSFSKVRRARCVDTRELVALKLLTFDGTIDDNNELWQNVLSETSALRDIRHKHIVKLLSWDRLIFKARNGKKYPCIILTQALCSKGQLFDYIQYAGKFEEYLAREVFSQILAGVEACHKKGYVHRDIKPENILLDENFTVKLCDFGFSKSFYEKIGEGGGAQKMMMTTQLGTKKYMAPEIWLNLPYTKSVDIWSMGVVLFFMIAGNYPLPYQATMKDPWFECLIRGQHKRFWDSHGRSNPNVSFSKEFRNLVLWLLEPSPNDRPNVDKIRKSDFMKKSVMNKEDYRKEMSQLKATLDHNCTDKVERGPLDGEIKRHFWDKPMNEITLRALVQNRFQNQLKSVKNQPDLLLAIHAIERQIGRNEGLKTNILIKDPIEVAEAMTISKDIESLRKVLDVGDSILKDVLTILKPGKGTLVDEYLNNLGGSVKAKFFEFENLELPRFDSETDEMPLTSFNVRCGFDIICFALYFVRKAKAKYKKQLDMNICSDKGVIQLIYRVKKDLMKPGVEKESGMSEQEMKRRKDLGLDSEDLENTAPPNLGKRVIMIEIKCFRYIDDSTLITFTRLDNDLQFNKEYIEFVNVVRCETCLSAFLVENMTRQDILSEEEEVEGANDLASYLMVADKPNSLKPAT